MATATFYMPSSPFQFAELLFEYFFLFEMHLRYECPIVLSWLIMYQCPKTNKQTNKGMKTQNRKNGFATMNRLWHDTAI